MLADDECDNGDDGDFFLSLSFLAVYLCVAEYQNSTLAPIQQPSPPARRSPYR